MAQLFSNISNLSWQQAVMWLIGGILIYLAIKRDMEPALLLPMGFGAILVNLPLSGAVPQIVDGVEELGVLNVMHLSTPQSAILSAVIFNALIIILLIPLALKGVRYRPRASASVLRGNLLVYGLGGVIAPFIGIKLIDIVISAVGLV